MSSMAEQVNRYQRSPRVHPLTCRVCRGTFGDCERRDVGLVAGDHHVLEARDVDVLDGSMVLLFCECCGSAQTLPPRLEHFVKRALHEKRGFSGTEAD